MVPGGFFSPHDFQLKLSAATTKEKLPQKLRKAQLCSICQLIVQWNMPNPKHYRKQRTLVPPSFVTQFYPPLSFHLESSQWMNPSLSNRFPAGSFPLAFGWSYVSVCPSQFYYLNCSSSGNTIHTTGADRNLAKGIPS